MRDIATESIVELLTLLGEALAACLLAVVGLGAEVAGLARLGVGIDALTVWFLFMGGLALYAGVYVLGYQTVLPQLTG